MAIQKYHLIGSHGDLDKLMQGINKYYYSTNIYLRLSESTFKGEEGAPYVATIGRFKEGSNKHDQENIIPFEGVRVIKKKTRFRFERIVEPLSI